MEDSKHHVFYYIVLFVILFLGFLTAWQVRWVLALLPFFYAVLAILHHATEHTLTPKIVLEYILIAGMGGAIFTFLLTGGVI